MPTGNLARPCDWWEQRGNKIVCHLCPRNCELSEGQRGFCFVRQNKQNKMHLTTYGKSTGFCVDPIEKKPLNHFLPGTPVLSFGTAGCNLGCKFCQNWDISKSKEIEILSNQAAPESIVKEAQLLKCRSIAFTYNDPIIWAEYAIDTAKVARENNLKTIAVTSGYITKQARPNFFKFIDAANIDLKGFSEEFYRKITLSQLKPVLETLKWLQQESDVWFEITNLIIPDENDSADELKKMCEWILENLGADIPIHFTAFHPDYKMLNKPRTPKETLLMARQIALSSGLNYPYIGNVYAKEAQSTICPNCNNILIERDWYELGSFKIQGGKCLNCNLKIPGCFEDQVGTWGSKRLPVKINSEQELNLSSEENRPPIKTKSSTKQKGIMPETNLSFTPRINFSEKEKELLLFFVTSVIQASVMGEDLKEKLPSELSEVEAYGGFVTLRRGSLLRGCRGSWGGSNPLKLGELLQEIARDSSLLDPRFPSIKVSELPFLTLEISIMYEPNRVEATGDKRLEAFEVGEHGLVLISGMNRGLLLPNVATENRWDKKNFIEQTCVKANLAKDAWLLKEVELLTFKTVIFDKAPEKDELEIADMRPEITHQLMQLVDALEEGKKVELRMYPEGLIKVQGLMGVQLETKAGYKSIKFGTNLSLVDLTKDVLASIKSDSTKNREIKDKVTKISVFGQGIDVAYEDYPQRVELAVNSVLLAQFNGQATITFPSDQRGQDPVAATFSAAGVSAEDWLEKRAKMTCFREHSFEREIKLDQNVRALAVAGQFYPKNPITANSLVEEMFENLLESKHYFPAVMLPHAGWQYCGSVIAKTLAGASIPPEVVLIGPKHTNHGLLWSVSSSDFWEVPGARVPVMSELREQLLENVLDLKSDTQAHEREHCLEVILPYLLKVQPELRILPIVVGAIDHDDMLNLSEGLSKIVQFHLRTTKRPLMFVISSDMNHFSPEEENRRRDGLALNALKSGNYRDLLRVCEDEQISMCGALAASIVMHSLSLLYKRFNAEVVAYQTSAATTGDISSVVGYAGVRFSL